MGLPYIIAGLVVGFIVGLTGVGGGSLMTPILLWFGITPTAAVGTDLLYAAITKCGGVIVHQRARNIDWQITGWLALGSVPASLLTVIGLHVLHPDIALMNNVIRHTLGLALVLTALAIVFKRHLLEFGRRRFQRAPLTGTPLIASTVLTGVALGVLVTLSSIGAGALGTVALLLLYPTIQTSRLVGTEIAHAVPLTLIAGLGHAGLGHIDWPLLGKLLYGSLPGIWIGSRLTRRLPDMALRPALAGMLLLTGAKLVW
ncbi:MAG: sulfite exporter TauE/SafE family protein [Burkholderiales bacterium]|nr:sulfite exporter TauE/SafE family protein [Burkholderiales bacterium]